MRPTFNIQVIDELRRCGSAHNEATPNPAFHVKLGQLKVLYKRWFGSKGIGVIIQNQRLWPHKLDPLSSKRAAYVAYRG